MRKLIIGLDFPSDVSGEGTFRYPLQENEPSGGCLAQDSIILSLDTALKISMHDSLLETSW